MINSEILSTGLLLSGGAGVLYYLRSIPGFIWKRVKKHLFFSVKIYQYDDLFDIIEKYMAKNYVSEYKDVEACLIQTTESNPGPTVTKSWGRYGSTIKTPISQSVRYKQEENVFIINYNKKKIFITKSKEKLDHVQNIKDVYFSKFTLSGWRSKDAIEDFLAQAVLLSKVSPEENIVKVHTNNNWGEWEAPITTKVKPLTKVILKPEDKNNLMEDINKFIESEDWYEDRGIPYKRGYCFYGPPGTGKTTLALGIAHHLQKSVRCLNLNSVDNDGRLVMCFRNIPDNSVLLIEDIDRVFSGRDNVRTDSKVSFSSFINCLDGAFYRQGLITIITTNHMDKLDPALLRTGRIDFKMEVSKPSNREISEYFALFYEKPAPVIKGKFGVTMSDVQEICLRNKKDMEIAKKELITKIKTINNESNNQKSKPW